MNPVELRLHAPDVAVRSVTLTVALGAPLDAIGPGPRKLICCLCREIFIQVVAFETSQAKE